jgi:hypothetical protein
MKRTFRGVLAALVVLATAAVFAPAAMASSDTPGAVYVLTNSPAGNAVLLYGRGGDGSLTPAGSFATGGVGSGTGLGSQNAVIVSDDHRRLFAVNAGSNTISSFRIRPHQLRVLDRTGWVGGPAERRRRDGRDRRQPNRRGRVAQRPLPLRARQPHKLDRRLRNRRGRLPRTAPRADGEPRRARWAGGLLAKRRTRGGGPAPSPVAGRCSLHLGDPSGRPPLDRSGDPRRGARRRSRPISLALPVGHTL